MTTYIVFYYHFHDTIQSLRHVYLSAYNKEHAAEMAEYLFNKNHNTKYHKFELKRVENATMLLS